MEIYCDVAIGRFRLSAKGGDGHQGQDGGDGTAGRDSGLRVRNMLTFFMAYLAIRSQQ